MVGSYEINVANATCKYNLTIKRNITIIKGDSGSGKSTLVHMIEDYIQNGPDSGVTMSCPISCRVIDGNLWREQLSLFKDCIVFIDEGNSFVTSQEFAACVKAGLNYYVIVTREKLDNLPYSVDEIYGIKSSGKYNEIEPVYHEMYHIYEEYTHNLPAGETITPDVIITEDSNAGYEFFCAAIEILHSSIKCSNVGGNSNIHTTATAIRNRSVLVIADGAAFGSHMERICQLILSGIDLHLFLPESFEWLLLDSDIVKDIPRAELDHAELYADSTRFFSWERYFTYLITMYTKNTHMPYKKDHLNNYYRHPNIIQKVLNHIKGIDFYKSED
ncbi:MAG: translation initiation factor 2 [Lachnospiraceae bacterium]|nr:translation initiation factor 2 [Lachnospiraceae bacterium]